MSGPPVDGGVGHGSGAGGPASGGAHDALVDLPGVGAWQWVPGPERPTLLVAPTAPGTAGRTKPDAEQTFVDEAKPASAAGDVAVAGADLSSLPQLNRLMDEVALLAMARVLHRARLFRDGAKHDTGQVLDVLRVAPRHAWIVRRWLSTLVTEGRLRYDPSTGHHHDLVAPDRVGYARARRELDEARRGLGYPPSMTRFFVATAERLPALLRDEAGVQELLFPDGSTDTAEGNYRDNLPSRWVNHAAAALIAGGTHSSSGPLRILEVGAGIGATTRPVLDALAGTELDYLFTDVSRFFLTSARTLLGNRPGMRFGLFDINRPPVGPEFTPGSRDVILAANVLHNARHVGRALAALRELLSPDGLLVLVESCREHYQALTSMYLLMSPSAEEQRWFTDVRSGQDRVFLSTAEWVDQLDAAGFDPLPVLPGNGHPLADAGQRVIAGRVRSNLARPDPVLVEATLAARLPPSDRPERIHAVDRVISAPPTVPMGEPR